MSVTDKAEAMSCVICDRVFLPKRRDARYCSAKCRKAASRGGINAKGQPHQAIHDVIRKALNNLAAMEKQKTIVSLILIALNLLTDDNKKKVYDMLRDYRFDDKQ
jgi:hypothetical protein